MSFRIGRKHAAHTYPQSRATTTVPLARNSASGPEEDDVTIAVGPAGTQVPWNARESSGVPPQTAQFVPITPKATGIVNVKGVIALSATTATSIQLFVERDGTPTPVPLLETVNFTGPGAAAIPFDVIVGAGANGPPLALGVQANISIKLTSSVAAAAVLFQDSSTITVQEVSPATG